MNIYESNLWFKDIDETLKELSELNELVGKTILITGASGLICSAVVDMLIRYNETQHKHINIVVAGRSYNKIRERFKPYFEREYFKFLKYDASLSDGMDSSVHYDYIVHGASNAYADAILKEPVETILSNFMGMKCLLDYARKNDVKRILYISSSEVYGQKSGSNPHREDEYGYIDPLNVRNSYSLGKCVTETLCVAYENEYGVDSVIVRPGHIYGPTASPYDNRVASTWAYAVARGEDIIMKSEGTQLRSYCYCIDCASAILKVLLKGKSIHVYNISNPASIVSIKEMVEILIESSGVRLKAEFPTEQDMKGFNPMSNSSLDATNLQALGWKGLFDAKRGFSHTVSILKEIINDCDDY